jgi:hypothetical protein
MLAAVPRDQAVVAAAGVGAAVVRPRRGGAARAIDEVAEFGGGGLPRDRGGARYAAQAGEFRQRRAARACRDILEGGRAVGLGDRQPPNSGNPRSASRR